MIILIVDIEHGINVINDRLQYDKQDLSDSRQQMNENRKQKQIGSSSLNRERIFWECQRQICESL